MLDKLFTFLGVGAGAVHKTAMVASIASNVVKAFEQEFGVDQNARDVAIDTLVALLQSHKGIIANSGQVAPQAA